MVPVDFFIDLKAPGKLALIGFTGLRSKQIKRANENFADTLVILCGNKTEQAGENVKR